MAPAGTMSSALTEIHTGTLAESRKRSRSASTLTTSIGTTGSKSLKRGCRPYGNTPGNTPTLEQPTTGRLARPITIQGVLYKQLDIQSKFAWWRLAACSRNVAVTTTTPSVRQTDKCILYHSNACHLFQWKSVRRNSQWRISPCTPGPETFVHYAIFDDFAYKTRLTLPRTGAFFAKHRMDRKESHQILAEDTPLSNFW